MPPRLKTILNTPESQRLLSTCWRQCFYKSQGFFFLFFLIINCCDIWGQLIKTYSVTVNKSTRNNTLGFLACTFAFVPEREVLQMETAENQSKKKKKTQNNPRKKQSRQSGVKIQMEEQQRLKNLSLSLLAQLFVAQQGFVSLTSQISSSFSLSYPPHPPTPSHTLAHTHSTLIILFLLLCLPTSHFLKRARIYPSTGALLIYAGPSQGQSRADILSHSSVRAFPKGIY